MWDWDSGHLGEGLESLTPQRVLSKACSRTGWAAFFPVVMETRRLHPAQNNRPACLGVVGGRILPSALGLQGYSYKVEPTPRHLPLVPLYYMLTTLLSLNFHPNEAGAELELWAGSH